MAASPALPVPQDEDAQRSAVHVEFHQQLPEEQDKSAAAQSAASPRDAPELRAPQEQSPQPLAPQPQPLRQSSAQLQSKHPPQPSRQQQLELPQEQRFSPQREPSPAQQQRLADAPPQHGSAPSLHV
jgi:hypothetical protein